jgi:hypothetical protein
MCFERVLVPGYLPRAWGDMDFRVGMAEFRVEMAASIKLHEHKRAEAALRAGLGLGLVLGLGQELRAHI